MDININRYLRNAYNEKKNQFEPEMYTNLADNVYMDAESDKTVKDALAEHAPYAAEHTRVLLQHGRALNMVTGETGEVTLTNSLAYPFNNSVVSVSLRAVRDTADYTVETYADAAINGGGVGRVIVTDKLRNGFKIAYTGGAASVNVKYTVRGGLM